jgi:hypothetical protein
MNFGTYRITMYLPNGDVREMGTFHDSFPGVNGESIEISIKDGDDKVRKLLVPARYTVVERI